MTKWLRLKFLGKQIDRQTVLHSEQGLCILWEPDVFLHSHLLPFGEDVPKLSLECCNNWLKQLYDQSVRNVEVQMCSTVSCSSSSWSPTPCHHNLLHLHRLHPGLDLHPHPHLHLHHPYQARKYHHHRTRD